MIYGEKFLNTNNSITLSIIESDIRNLDILLNTDILNESTFTDAIKKAFNKILEIIAKLLGLVGNLIKKILPNFRNKLVKWENNLLKLAKTTVIELEVNDFVYYEFNMKRVKYIADTFSSMVDMCESASEVFTSDTGKTDNARSVLLNIMANKDKMNNLVKSVQEINMSDEDMFRALSYPRTLKVSSYDSKYSIELSEIKSIIKDIDKTNVYVGEISNSLSKTLNGLEESFKIVNKYIIDIGEPEMVPYKIGNISGERQNPNQVVYRNGLSEYSEWLKNSIKMGQCLYKLSIQIIERNTKALAKINGNATKK